MQIYAISNGTSTNLSTMQRYIRLGDEGLGMAPLRRLVSRGPSQHGDTDVGFRLDPRTIQLVIGAFGTDDRDYWNARKELLGIFAPADDPISLRFVLPNHDERQIDLHYTGGMDFASSDRQRIAHRVGIALKANDPTFYDPTERTVIYRPAADLDAMAIPTSIPTTLGARSGMAIPTVIPTVFGGTSINQVNQIVYPGSWNSLPVITIYGPITAPIIRNVSTGEVLRFTTATSIRAGDWYRVDCRYGRQTVTDSTGANRIAQLDDTSDLATFHIARSREVAGGINEIQVSGVSATSATTITITYYDRYLGI